MLRQADGGSGTFGTRLRALRERAGLTQEELAERAGLTAHAVSALERGTRTRPYPHTVRSLAAALGVSGDEQRVLTASVPRRGSATADGSVPAAAVVETSVRLVVPATRLHGRDADVAALASLLRSRDCRLVTLTGTGGVGKSRLAAAVAEVVTDEFPDGCVSLALAALAEGTAVLDAVGRALGLTGCDGPGAVDVLAAHLQERRVLLVLDNLEHLLDAAVDIGTLVSRCSALTVLVASRSPLRVGGEHEYPVSPLHLPAAPTTTLQELVAAPAGALAVDRARAVAPGLEMTPDTVSALVQLCRRLAGIPLAIELATARLRILAPGALLERLDSVVNCASTARDLPPRHRTMRATLDWSRSLLTPDQQLLFRLLAVFRGGATLAAVERVAGGATQLPAADVLGLLEQLVEQSMLVVRSGPDGELRYTMLEPVAQYARTLLVGDEAARAEQIHGELYRELAERAAAGYERGDQVEWLARTEADEANLLVAAERAREGGRPELAGRIVWALWLYWWLRGQARVGWSQAERCLTVDLPDGLRGRVHLTAATMSYAAGDIAAAQAHWDQALRLGRAVQDPEVTCKALAGTGLAAMAAGALDRAASCFRGSLPVCLEAGAAGTWMRSLVQIWLGTVVLLNGDPAGAVREIDCGLRLARSRGDRLSTYVALYNLSQAAIAGGQHDRARAHLVEGIELSEQTRDLANLAYFLDALAVVESTRSAHGRVAVLLGAAQSFRDTVGSNVYAYYVPDEALREEAERAARRALGDDVYEDRADAGRALDLPGAVRYALAVTDQPTAAERGRAVGGLSDAV